MGQSYFGWRLLDQVTLKLLLFSAISKTSSVSSYLNSFVFKLLGSLSSLQPPHLQEGRFRLFTGWFFSSCYQGHVLMKSHHPVLPGGSGLLGTKAKATGGASLNPDLVMSVGYLMSLSACPCLRLPSCEIKPHAPPSRSGVCQEKGTLRMDMQGHAAEVWGEMTALCSCTALGLHSWMRR